MSYRPSSLRLSLFVVSLLTTCFRRSLFAVDGYSVLPSHLLTSQHLLLPTTTRTGASCPMHPAAASSDGIRRCRIPTSLWMGVSKRRRSMTTRGDSVMGTRYSEKLKEAARFKIGTKRYVNPNKVFLGNVPFQATEDDIADFLLENGAVAHRMNIKAVKIVRDWKTGESKGYAFVMFTDPMAASNAMEACKNKKIMGRTIRLDQGKKKWEPSQRHKVVVQDKKTAAVDAEEAAIQSGLHQAATGDVGASMEDLIAYEKEKTDGLHLFGEEEDLDDGLEEDYDVDKEDYDLDEDGYLPDAKFASLFTRRQFSKLSEEEQKMNRENRREAQKRKKLRLDDSAGFGGSIK